MDHDILKKQIALGNVEAVFEELANNSINGDLLNEVFLLEGQHNTLQLKQVQGVISYDEASRHLNNITLSLLKLIDRLFEYEKKPAGYNVIEWSESQIEDCLIISKENATLVKKNDHHITLIDDYSNRNFILHLIQNNNFIRVSAPFDLRIRDLAKIIADSLFPFLKNQHFEWRLTKKHEEIPQDYQLRLINIAPQDFFLIQARYVHTSFLPKASFSINDSWVACSPNSVEFSNLNLEVDLDTLWTFEEEE